MANDKTTDEAETASIAADEPTAVWDASTLREAGLADLIKKADSLPPPAATAPDKSLASGPSMLVDGAAAGAPVQHVAGNKTVENGSAGEFGWASTLALAAGLGAAVYLVIRFLR